MATCPQDLPQAIVALMALRGSSAQLGLLKRSEHFVPIFSTGDLLLFWEVLRGVGRYGDFAGTLRIAGELDVGPVGHAEVLSGAASGNKKSPIAGDFLSAEAL
jgi:hypothetical protein